MAERVLVTGSRDYRRRSTIRRALEELQADGGIELVIHGACRGADKLAESVATELGITYVGVPAEWRKYNPGAGPMRNQRMIDEWAPTLVLAFHDDIENSRGTKDLVRRAEKAGVPVRIITTDDGR